MGEVMPDKELPLAVTIIGGRNWADPIQDAHNEEGNSQEIESYCTVNIGGQSYTTKVFKGNPTEPNWRETFHFDVTGLWHENIEVKCYQKKEMALKNLLGTLVGEARVHLEHHKDVPLKFALDHWYPFGHGGGAKKKMDKGGKARPGKVVAQGEIGLIIGTDDSATLPDGTLVHKSDPKEVLTSLDSDYVKQRTTDQLWDDANAQQLESKKVVKQMKNVVNETMSIAAQTAQNLDKQGQQMRQVQDDADVIQATAKQAHRKLRVIECCCCCFVNWFNSGKNAKRKAEIQTNISAKKQEMKAVKERNAEQSRQRELAHAERTKNKRKHRLQREEEDEGPLTKSQEFARHQEEIENGIDEIGNVVEDLKGLAQNLNEEVENQNLELDLLQPEVDKTTGKVTEVIARTRMAN